MIINLSPQINGKERPVVSVQGDILTINDEDFDFSPMGPGDQLPAVAVQSDFLDRATMVTKSEAGEIELTLLLPMAHGETSEGVLFPQPVQLGGGVLMLPQSVMPFLVEASQ